jgi:hypothetical protein
LDAKVACTLKLVRGALEEVVDLFDAA